jgi:hypothetical protein
LYNALHTAFSAPIAALDPKAKLAQAVIAALPAGPIDFAAIQGALTAQCIHLDEARTADLMLSRANLNPTEHGFGMAP